MFSFDFQLLKKLNIERFFQKRFKVRSLLNYSL